MTDTKTIQKQVRVAFESRPEVSFPPVVFYDEDLDCIRIVVNDASIMEHRVNELLTILEDNYPEGGRRYIGFTIKGAKHFCSQQGFSAQRAVTLADLLDGVVKAIPSDAVNFVVDSIARPLVEEAGIEDKAVELPSDHLPDPALA